MTELAFNLAFPLAVPFWALMIVAPHWRWTRTIVSSPLIVLAPLVAYLFAVIPIFPEFAAEMVNPSFDGVREIVSTADGTALVWAHLTAFDLFVGRWMYLDSRERGIPALVMAPLLVLTILLAPFGLTIYLALRTRWAAPA
ncbi:ABA4-like family protein [Virgisporangium aurantiacum]|uniref:DUF4281 domain-containing protein n=1 Tax=Virgisporangium aurantiacum TaxID=175570 RepID=A0A8J4E0N7_9ACTN|nr:ABA4-like family protein [Virgisporangium aurantiacum]GIJ57925.1 hypothetical protein Vau01_054410 [Virgisporangium aurantiacum]